MRASYALIAIFFIVTLGWASQAEIDQFVKGSGRIIPSGKIKKIQHLEGGIVSSILVKEGEIVKAGDELFKIKNQVNESELESNLINTESLKIRLARLMAERDEKNFIMDNPIYPDVYSTELELFATRKKEIENEIKLISQTISQKRLKLNQLNSRINNYSSEYNTSKRSSDISFDLYQNGALSEARYLEDKMRLQEVASRLSETRREIPIIKSEILEATIQQKKVTQDRQNQVAKEINQIQIKIKGSQQNVLSSEDKILRTSIISPIDGVINKIYLNTTDGILPAGGILAEIIPSNDLLIVEGKIAVKDRAKIWPGNQVNIQVSAYDYRDYGILSGTLVEISADSFEEDGNNFFYQVKIQIENNNKQRLVSGMTTQINIITGKKTILDYLISPIIDIAHNSLSET